LDSIKENFVMRKVLSLVLVLAALTACTPSDTQVSGHFNADGHDSSINYIRLANAKNQYTGSPILLVALTEKDASDAKALDSSTIAFSHKYGTAITMVIVKNDKGVYEVEDSAFHHSGSDKAGGTSPGAVQLKDMSDANGFLSGDVYTKPGSQLFDATVDIDVKFKTPLPK
jgi:hypothetical protein